MSAFQATLPVQASPAIPAMTPMSIQTPTAAALAAAAASSAPAMSAAWSAARSSPHIPDHLPASMTGAGQTPDIGYFHGSRVEAMHEDSDAGTEDMDTAPLSRGSHAEWRDLVEHAKLTLPVAYRSDGPQLAFVFDEPPSPDGADGNDPDGPAKRKRVMVDGYEMEDDGEDGMNVSRLASIMLTACMLWLTVSQPCLLHHVAQDKSAMHNMSCLYILKSRVFMHNNQQQAHLTGL